MPPIFDLIAARSSTPAAEMHEVFNMGCGFCAVVGADQAEDAVALLGQRHPGAAIIGSVTDSAGLVEVPGADLAGRADAGFAPA